MDCGTFQCDCVLRFIGSTFCREKASVYERNARDEGVVGWTVTVKEMKLTIMSASQQLL